MKNLHINEEGLTELSLEKLILEQEESKKKTGYASIDKPWLQFYDAKKLKEELPEMTVYDYLKESNVNNPKTTAINYFGNNISYENLIDKKIIEVAKAYSKLGIKKGDKVAFLVPALPESIYSFYALSILGAVSCFIDPRSGNERIKKSLNNARANVLVTIDLATPKVDRIVDDTYLDKVIVVPATNSLPFGMNYIIEGKKDIKRFLGKLPSISGYTKWNSFVSDAKKSNFVSNDYEKDTPVSVVYTSGTSGDPKGVVISNDALNAIAHQYKISPVPHYIGDKFLNVMPTFLLYGLACGIHMPLSLGMTDVVIPQVNRESFPKLVLKHEPKHYMVNPDLMDSLVESPLIKNKTLSYLISAGIGGSGIEEEQEKKFVKFLQEHGCDYQLASGYGATEGGSALAAVLSKEAYLLQSVGIPLPCNTISIFDYSIDDNGEVITTDNELVYNQSGEICATGPTLMLEYLNNPELTKKKLVKHSDGKVWLHTGDKGFMDEEGHLFVDGRIDRMIIRPDSHNVYLPSIEHVISKHQAISACAVVGVKPDSDKPGKLPKAVIVIKEEYLNNKKHIIDELIEMCNNELPERDVAYYYEIVPELPMSLAGKVDYKKLENEVIGEFIDANIQISNLVNEKVLSIGSHK